jgi:argininosuccinate synthase
MVYFNQEGGEVNRLVTYDKGDAFDQSASPGFIHIWGLPARTQAKAQPEPHE